METVKKQGYKQTELGLIPEDWEVSYLGEFLDFKNGLNKEKRFFGYGTSIVNYMDVFSYRGIKSKSQIRGRVYVSPQEINNYSVKKDDVLFTRTSETPDEIGINSVILVDLGSAVFSGFVLRGRPKNDRLLSEFNQFLFSNSLIRKQIIQRSSYTTRALTNGRALSSIKIPIPPKKEQTAIATALSDMDSYISSLEALIAKKRLIKQGAMQELLTPKEDWEVREFGELCNPSKLKFNPIISESTPCVELEDVSQNSGRLIGISDSKDKMSLKTVFKKGDVLLGKLRPYLRKYFHADFDGVCSTEIWALKANSGIDSKFLFYLVQSDKVIEAANLSTGTKMPRAEWKTVSKTMIHVPLVSEQKEIASILGTLDSNILSLEKLLGKNEATKQSMMQDLLTGRVRLV